MKKKRGWIMIRSKLDGDFVGYEENVANFTKEK